MAEYINREIAKESLRMNQHRFTCADEANGFGSVKWSEDVIYAEAAQKVIDTIPSADVAEVVRCKDCSHSYKTSYPSELRICLMTGFANSENHFCSDGKRMDGET